MTKYTNTKKERLSIKLRTIKEMRKNLLVDSIKKRKQGKTNVVSAPTNIGKTFSIYMNVVPQLVKEGVEKTIVTAPDTMIHKQSLDAYENNLVSSGIAVYTLHDFERFIKAKHKAILLISTAKATHDKSRDRIIRLAEKLGNKFTFIADEIHYGGTTEAQFALDNMGSPPSADSKYSLANLLVELSGFSKNVLAYTATPLHEMFKDNVDMYGIPISKYNIITKDEDWPQGAEHNLFSARLGGVVFVDNWMNTSQSGKQVEIINALFDHPKYGLQQHWKNKEYYTDKIKECAQNTEHENKFNNNIEDRTITHIIAGSHFQSGPSDNSADVNEVLTALQKKLLKYPKRYKNKCPIMVVMSGECKVYDIDYDNNDNSKSFKKDQIEELCSDERYGIEFIISVEMLKLGWNEKRISHFVSTRRRKQSRKDEDGYEDPVVNTGLQSFARAIRQLLGFLEVNSIDDLNQMCANLPANLKSAIIEYSKYMNTCYGILPDEVYYRKAIDIFQEKYTTDIPFTWGTCKIEDHICNDPFCTI